MKKILENWNKYLKEQREFWGYNISPEQKISLTLKPITNIRVVKQAEYDVDMSTEPREKGDYAFNLAGERVNAISSGTLDKRRTLISDKPHVHPKPDGLWYACGSKWIDYLEDVRKRGGLRVEEGNNYMYELDIDYSKMYRMNGDDSEGRDKLERKYGFYFKNTNKRRRTKEINWAEMQKDGYTGIEICPYTRDPNEWIDEYRRWYGTWSIAGGCIWDPKAIKGIKLLATQPGTPGKGYTEERPPTDEEESKAENPVFMQWPRRPIKPRIPGVNPPIGWEEGEPWGKK